MNNLTKVRLFALAGFIVMAWMMYGEWRDFLQHGRYHLKIAALGPLAITMALYLLAFPSKVGKPETTKDKISGAAVFGIGIVAGLVNWYLMDPGRFGWN